jgi:DDE superfamily endonuclease
MAKPYSMDLGDRAMGRLAAGESSRVVAAAPKVAVSSVIKWAARERRFRSVAPGRMGGHRRFAISGEHRLFVLRHTQNRSARRAGLAWRGTTAPAMDPLSRPVRPAPHCLHRRNLDQDQHGGWGTRGERLITHVPHGRWHTMTFIGALRYKRIEAPRVLDVPINAEACKTYVRAELVNTLKPDDIVVLDNVNSHIVTRARWWAPWSKRSTPGCSSCRPTVPTSIRSILRLAQEAFAKIKHAKGDGPHRRGRRNRRRRNPRHHRTPGMRERPRKLPDTSQPKCETL